MNLDSYNAYCASLPATSHVVQWRGSHVWKVGGKVFAIAGWPDNDAAEPFVTFKCSELSYSILKEQDGMRPAPYMASRGMKWIQVLDHAVMGEAALRSYLSESHRLAGENLTRKTRRELGLG